MSQKFLRILILALLSLLSAFSAEAQSTFKGIVPLVTTRPEVERMLGRPDKHGRYELDEGRAVIRYVSARCPNQVANCLCIAPLDTVLTIEFYPYRDIRVEDFILDDKTWRRFPVTGGHVPGLEVYVNEKLGISYHVDSNVGLVTEITYDVSEETCKVLNNGRSPK